MRRGQWASRRLMPLLLLFVCVVSPKAQAWDRHVYITRATLNGFQTQNVRLWKRLSEKVLVTPIEQFLSKAFGKDCTFAQARETVFRSVGERFQVMYVEGADYHNEMDFKHGTNVQVYSALPVDSTKNSQALGKMVSPYEVLSVYSDEPDWGMDDDVPSLRKKGSASKNKEGSATRLLRHFWYKGETHFGVDFGKDQEADERMQLYYELALVAFSVDEPYWGYRFLADSIHYLQDMVQPFHVQAIINSDMVDHLALIHGALCDQQRRDGKIPPPDLCRPEDSLDSGVIINGWIVGAYHALYEDFVMGLVRENTFDSIRLLESGSAPESLRWPEGEDKLLDLRKTLVSAHDAILPVAPSIGTAMWGTFGSRYKLQPEATAMASLKVAGTVESRAYRLARQKKGVDDQLVAMQGKQLEAFKKLLGTSQELLARAGDWGRSFVEKTIQSADEQARVSPLATDLKRIQCR